MRNELNAMIQKIDDAEYKKVRKAAAVGPRLEPARIPQEESH